MLHLWSLATWGIDVTHDAGKPEWIDTPVTRINIGDLSPGEGRNFDGSRWTVRLPRTLYLLTAWYMDELCEHLYVTCQDPHGITVQRILDELEVEEDLPRLHIAGINLKHLWYTVDGIYTFTSAFCYGGLPYQHLGSFRVMLAQKEE